MFPGLRLLLHSHGVVVQEPGCVAPRRRARPHGPQLRARAAQTLSNEVLGCRQGDIAGDLRHGRRSAPYEDDHGGLASSLLPAWSLCRLIRRDSHGRQTLRRNGLFDQPLNAWHLVSRSPTLHGLVGRTALRSLEGYIYIYIYIS